MKIREGRIPAGKGMFIYYLYRLCDGDMARLAKQLFDEGYQWVAPRVQEGRIVWDAKNQQELLADLVPYLEEYGIELHIWGYVWLKTSWGRVQWDQELAISLEMIAKWKPQSFIVNCEEERDGLRGYANSYMVGLRNGMSVSGDHIPDVPIGFSSHRFSGPNYHPKVPWKEFLNYSDYACPQVYWQGDSRPDGGVLQLIQSISQWQVSGNLPDDFPFVPAGTVYNNGSWWPSPEQLQKFNEFCKQTDNIIGVNYWEYYYLLLKERNREELTLFEWPRKEDTAPIPGDPCADLKTEILTELQRFNQAMENKLT